MTLKELLDVVEPELAMTAARMIYRITGRLEGSLTFIIGANDETDEVLEAFGERAVKSVQMETEPRLMAGSELVIELD